LLYGLLETDGEVKLGFNGDLYPTAGASVVMTTSGDMVKYQSGARARLGIGSANQLLQVKSSLPSWETVDLADTVLTTAGDVLYENNTPELARLPKGSDDDILTLASGLPTWASAGSGGGSYVRLDAQELGSDTGVITYTPGSALTEAKYAMIVVVIETEVTSSGTLQMQVNNDDSSSYFTDGQKYNSGSATVIDVSSATKWDIMDSTSTGTNSHTVVMLSMGDSAFAAARLRGTSQGSSQDLGYFVGLELDEQGTPPTITEIEVSNSAGNLKAGTKMTTFGVERS